MHVMLGLLGLKIGELHGDLSQTQVDYFLKKKHNFKI
jgi:hypothetical protein